MQIENQYIIEISTYVLFLFVINIIFANLADHKYFNKNQTGYLNILTILFFLFTIGLFINVIVKRNILNPLYLIAYILIAILTIGTIYYIYTRLNATTILFFKYLASFLFFFMILVFLAIVANFSYEYFMKKFRGTFVEFIFRFIFFLPCLLIDFLKFLLKDFQSTPYITPILIIIEVVLILLYIYIPVFLDNLSFKNYTLIRDEPFFLRNELYYQTNVAVHKNNLLQFLLPRPVDETRIYSFSLWMLIKQTNDSTIGINDFPLFTYGDNKSFRPQITYHTHSKNHEDSNDPFTDKIRVYVSETTMYDLLLSKQKWYNLVITYFEDKVEIYVNGELVKVINSKDIINDVSYFTSNYNVFLGSKDYAFGKVVPDIVLCNVHLYTIPLSYIDVANVYNVGKNTYPYPGGFT
jgi:hypothetical protein